MLASCYVASAECLDTVWHQLSGRRAYESMGLMACMISLLSLPAPAPPCTMQMMLFLGWNLQGSEGSFVIDSGWGSFWTKLAASWLCAGMYTWSLVAHRVLSSRQF